MLGAALDVFKSRRRNANAIAPGAVYRHATKTQAVETARVLDVSMDTTGIAHVRFHVHISRGDTTFVDEERILALESFRDRFRDRDAV